MNYFLTMLITYLVDVVFNVGKGSNSIISMINHFFVDHG